MPTPNLNITHITGSQNNKETTANLAFDNLDKAMNTLLVVPITANSRTLSSAELRGAAVFRLIGTRSVAFGLIIPANIARVFAVENQTNQSVVIQVASGGSDSQTLAAGGTGLFYTDGDDVVALSVAGSAVPTVTSYDLGIYIAGIPASSETVMRYVVTTGFTIPSGFTNSRADAAVASTGTIRFTVRKNSSIIGAIQFAASSTGVFSGAGATFVAGDILRIDADEYGDVDTLSDISITIKGTRT
jgi:hypothetical protein